MVYLLPLKGISLKANNDAEFLSDRIRTPIANLSDPGDEPFKPHTGPQWDLGIGCWISSKADEDTPCRKSAYKHFLFMLFSLAFKSSTLTI